MTIIDTPHLYRHASHPSQGLGVRHSPQGDLTAAAPVSILVLNVVVNQQLTRPDVKLPGERIGIDQQREHAA